MFEVIILLHFSHCLLHLSFRAVIHTNYGVPNFIQQLFNVGLNSLEKILTGLQFILISYVTDCSNAVIDRPVDLVYSKADSLEPNVKLLQEFNNLKWKGETFLKFLLNLKKKSEISNWFPIWATLFNFILNTYIVFIPWFSCHMLVMSLINLATEIFLELSLLVRIQPL